MKLFSLITSIILLSSVGISADRRAGRRDVAFSEDSILDTRMDSFPSELEQRKRAWERAVLKSRAAPKKPAPKKAAPKKAAPKKAAPKKAAPKKAAPKKPAPKKPAPKKGPAKKAAPKKAAPKKAAPKKAAPKKPAPKKGPAKKPAPKKGPAKNGKTGRVCKRAGGCAPGSNPMPPTPIIHPQGGDGGNIPPLNLDNSTQA